MAPKFSKYPIATSVAWTARYNQLQSAGLSDEDYATEVAKALRKIRHFEGREDVRTGIEEVWTVHVDQYRYLTEHSTETT